jgi:glycosyltransferase involved in cell wall biosynthesis
MLLSVIIPTHRRCDILRQTLECLRKQTFKDFEAVVVSDGPDEKAAEMIQNLSWPFELQYFAIPKSQQGVARNRAVEKARGRYCLLIGDDIFLAEDACEVHLRAHEKATTYHLPPTTYAVLGFTTWDPALKITPAMRWMERSGVQFGYPRIQQYARDFIPRPVQHWFTYTSHLSLPTYLLRHHPFREDVALYGWEDIEWGKRLAEAGVPLFYDPDARAYHHHVFTDEEVWERSRQLGFSAGEMERLVPSLRLCPRGWKRAAYAAYASLPTRRGKHCRMFLQGLRFSLSRPRSRAPAG